MLDRQSIEEATLPGSEGQIQILAGHAGMIGSLELGEFSFKSTQGERTYGVVSSGYFEVLEGQVNVMAETIELKGEIDAARARQAQTNAENTLRGAELDEQMFKKYQLKLQRSLIRQQVAGKEHGQST